MRRQLMSWPEVEAYLTRSKGIIVPIGATEQHGPVGLVGTDAICAELFGDRDGDHASASEVSVAAAAYPDHLKTAVMAAEPPPTSRVFGPADFRRRYPEGRMGSHPELATVAAGRAIIAAVAADIAEEYRRFLGEA